MKRLFDIILSFSLLLVFTIPILFIAMMVKITSRGPALYASERVGVNNAIFRMFKFRTMKIDTPQVATHLMENPEQYLTSVGKFLRKTSLDELPQLLNILKGDMSFVGPRPALFNQHDLVELRTRKGISSLVPGLTGWAQINGRDELPVLVKVEYDEYYYKNHSFFMDIKILFMTLFKVMRSEGVKH
jgi:O-antigen biosynthesis protein WbqP